MIKYFIVFMIAGFVIGEVLKEMKKALPVMIVVSGLWTLVYPPIWGLATLLELSLGFYIYVLANQDDKSMRGK